MYEIKISCIKVNSTNKINNNRDRGVKIRIKLKENLKDILVCFMMMTNKFNNKFYKFNKKCKKIKIKFYHTNNNNCLINNNNNNKQQKMKKILS